MRKGDPFMVWEQKIQTRELGWRDEIAVEGRKMGTGKITRKASKKNTQKKR